MKACNVLCVYKHEAEIILGRSKHHSRCTIRGAKKCSTCTNVDCLRTVNVLETYRTRPSAWQMGEVHNSHSLLL